MPIISQSWSLLQTLIAFVGLYVAGVQTEEINRRLPAAKLFEKKAGSQVKNLTVYFISRTSQKLWLTPILTAEKVKHQDSDLAAISFIVVPAICVIWSCRHESQYRIGKTMTESHHKEG